MFKKILKWGGGILLVAYLALVVGRAVYFELQNRTQEQVAKIHATKLALDDVLGKNLPPEPAGAEADKTVAGVDANANGIRDDVELAIFKEYPNSAKTRAVLLQYALALQMEVTQPIVNEGTVIAVAQKKSQAAGCIADVTPRDNIQKFITTTRQFTDFVKRQQINTNERDQAQIRFYEKLGSYTDIDSACDIDLQTLPN